MVECSIKYIILHSFFMELIMEKIKNIGVEGFNSYLILAEKNVIIDTVPERFYDEFLKNIEKNISPFEIDYLVMGRTTPDASGSVKKLISKNKNIEVFATVAGLKNLKEILNQSFNENLIKNEVELDLGCDKLKFLITPNLSWPDTAVFYLKNEKVLFSQNLFCESPEQHAFQKIFLDNAIERIKNLDIVKMLPAYGTAKDINIYDNLFVTQDEIVVLYQSLSGQTKIMAQTVFEELLEMGENPVLIDVLKMPYDEILYNLNKAKAFAFGTPTINHNAAQSILDIIIRMDVLKNAEKKVFVFGSYGWSGEGVNIITSLLGNMKMKPCKKPYRSIFNPSDESLSELKRDVRKFFEEN